MKDQKKMIRSAVIALLALSLSQGQAKEKIHHAEREKCYGIAKKGFNDCSTPSASCAGSAVKDNQPDAYLFLPKGLCKKIVGGSLTPKINKEKKS